MASEEHTKPEQAERAIAELEERVARLEAERDEYLADVKRVAADFDNYRRRALREQNETTQRAAERVVGELLPALDSFDAALAVEASTDSEEKLLAGMHRTHDQILTILRGQGLDIIATVGEYFDPEVHEAVMSPTEGEGRLVVTEELRRGYRLKDRLVRPALVALEYEGSGQ
jgi:molecular chaperone GrpE